MAAQQRSAPSTAAISRSSDLQKDVMKGFQRELKQREESFNTLDLLHDAAFKGNVEVVKTFLVGRNSNKEKDDEVTTLHVDFPHPKDGRSVLHSAAQGLPSGIIELLVKPPYLADIEARDFRGRTPLLHACALGQSRIVTRLIAFGADENTMDDEGMGAGLVTAQAGHINMVLWLHHSGVNIHTPTKDGRTAMHMAAFAGQTHGKQQHPEEEEVQQPTVTPLCVSHLLTTGIHPP